eukprot:8570852-Ditylum_brightwellii.AAC.1
MILLFILSLLLYKRYIDDIIGVWVPKDEPTKEEVEWRVFKTLLNMWFGLEWMIIESNNTVDIMDLTVTLKDEKITTTLFEKSLNLYTYIPPHSDHPPGVLNGVIFGQIHCIYCLCLERKDIIKSISQFYLRLIQRGYQCQDVMSIFTKTIHYNSPTMI